MDVSRAVFVDSVWTGTHCQRPHTGFPTFTHSANEVPQGELHVMPKMKTHSGAKKRFKKTGNGKIKRKKANKGHLLTKKNSKRKRHLRKSTIVDDKANRKRIKRMLSS